MSEGTKIALKTLLAFVLKDIANAIMNSLPDFEEEVDDDPIAF